MSGNEDPSGDYGYDLAHEVKSFLGLIPTQRKPVTCGLPHRELDPESDFGYDHAHED